jgi:hypothetical protein
MTSPIATPSVTIRCVAALILAAIFAAVAVATLADTTRDGSLMVAVVLVAAAIGQLLTAWSAATLLAATRHTPPDPTWMRQSLMTLRLSRGWTLANLLIGPCTGGVVAATSHNLTPLGLGTYSAGIVTVVHLLALRHHGRQVDRVRPS